VVNIRHSWNRISQAYVRDYKISTRNVHFGPLCPGENNLQLLGNLSGKKVLEMGCGAGQNAIALSRMGADVTAVDISENQIKQAKALAVKESAKISFIPANINDLPSFPDSSFDLVFSACAIAFVKEIEKTFSEAYRLLKQGGTFILSDMHPLQYIFDEIPGGVKFNHPYPFNPILLKWTWDFKNEDGTRFETSFKHYVKSISAYHNALVDAGFAVRKILEPKSTIKTPHIGFSREILREYKYIAEHLPVTFIIVAGKP
jgi:ubiquinone/menaquinone biosynthesis C-methylase UbiE